MSLFSRLLGCMIAQYFHPRLAVVFSTISPLDARLIKCYSGWCHNFFFVQSHNRGSTASCMLALDLLYVELL